MPRKLRRAIPPELTRRFAGPEDVPELVELIRSAYRGEASRAGWTSEAHLVDGERTGDRTLLRVIGSPRSRLLIARDPQGAAVACCQIEDRGEGVVHFGAFAVAPPRQAGGVGRWLMAEAERAAIEVFAARTFEIAVLAQQPALIAWYERRGFVATGERRPFPSDPRFARPRREGLEFVVMSKALGIT